MINRVLIAYYFSLECLFLYLLLFLFYTRTEQIPPILAFLVILGIGNLILLHSMRLNAVSQVIPFIGGIVTGLISYILGFTPMSAFISAIFLYVRVDAFLKDSSLWLEERKKLPIIFYCSSFILIVFGWINNYQYIHWFFITMLTFSLLFSIGRYLQQITNNKHKNNIHSLFGSLLFAAIITGLVTLLFPLIRWLLLNLLEGLVKIVGFVFTPFFNLVESIVIYQKPKGPKEDAYINLDKLKIKETNESIIQSNSSWILILLFIIILIVLIGIWSYLRKLKKLPIEKSEQILSVEIERNSVLENIKRKHRFFRHSKPQEHIRKLIFQLQLFAEKHNMGRYDHETVREWFNRNQFNADEDFLNTYENVRYGERMLSNKNEKYYEEQIKKIKSRIKEKSREKG